MSCEWSQLCINCLLTSLLFTLVNFLNSWFCGAIGYVSNPSLEDVFVSLVKKVQRLLSVWSLFHLQLTLRFKNEVSIISLKNCHREKMLRRIFTNRINLSDERIWVGSITVRQNCGHLRIINCKIANINSKCIRIYEILIDHIKEATGNWRLKLKFTKTIW